MNTIEWSSRPPLCGTSVRNHGDCRECFDVRGEGIKFVNTVNMYTGWWFDSLWKILVNWVHYSQYMGKYKMFQTTNQYIKWKVTYIWQILVVKSPYLGTFEVTTLGPSTSAMGTARCWLFQLGKGWPWKDPPINPHQGILLTFRMALTSTRALKFKSAIWCFILFSHMASPQTDRKVGPACYRCVLHIFRSAVSSCSISLRLLGLLQVDQLDRDFGSCKVLIGLGWYAFWIGIVCQWFPCGNHAWGLPVIGSIASLRAVQTAACWFKNGPPGNLTWPWNIAFLFTGKLCREGNLSMAMLNSVSSQPMMFYQRCCVVPALWSIKAVFSDLFSRPIFIPTMGIHYLQLRNWLDRTPLKASMYSFAPYTFSESSTTAAVHSCPLVSHTLWLHQETGHSQDMWPASQSCLVALIVALAVDP